MNINKCVLCTRPINTRNTGLKCGGQCQLYFHNKCVKLSDDEMKVYASSGGSSIWFCSGCMGASTADNIIIDASVCTAPANSLPNIELLDNATRKDIIGAVREIARFQKFQSQQFDDMKFTFDHVINKVNEMENKMHSLLMEQQILKSTINSLQWELHILNQEKINNNVVISGIPNSYIQPIDNVKNISKFIGADINDDDIDEIRLVNTPNKYTKEIQTTYFVQFKSNEIKCNFMKNKKSINHILPQQIGIPDTVKVITYRAQTTKYIMQLLTKAKELKVELNFKFIWINSNNEINLRKNEQSKIYTIKTEDDIWYLRDKLKNII